MTDIEYRNGYYTEYILPYVVNILSIDDITIECGFSGIMSVVQVHWVCLYSEEKLQSMEKNLKVETLSSDVKIIDYKQFNYYNKYLIT